FGEFDIGPTFSAGPLVLTPMIGAGFNWSTKQMTYVIPQFYTTLNSDSLYGESWLWLPLFSLNHSGGPNQFYTRDFLLFKATHDFRIGPALELTIGLNDAGKGGAGGKTLQSLPVGGMIEYNAKADWQGTIGIFLGVETQTPNKINDKLVGRLTYIHTF
ncbi:MAG TPA: hypothetical protein VL137_11890, partial [Polyangiaceae bacterium]|nr:hypothetical protein [Polyangiaceae bacterium]